MQQLQLHQGWLKYFHVAYAINSGCACNVFC
jgi:hypothetical protein